MNAMRYCLITNDYSMLHDWYDSCIYNKLFLWYSYCNNAKSMPFNKS